MKRELLFACLLVIAVLAVKEDKDDAKRIVGGSESEAGQFPFMALITNKDNLDKICGAAIIAEEWVLTSARCVKDRALDNTAVKAGMVNASNSEDTIQVRDVVSFHVHPEHDSSNPVVNDVALVKVAKFTYNQHLSNIPLAEAGSEYQGPAFVMGWGKSDGENENSLKMGHVDVDTTEECQNGLKTYCGEHSDNVVCQKLDSLVWDKLLCSIHSKLHWDSGACDGDLGGPLARLKDDRDECIGVISEIIGECGKGFTLYPKVSKYVDWINSVTLGVEDESGVLLENL